MIRPLTFVTVRQQQHDSRLLTPLGASRGDELIDDRLSTVGEIAELGFPQHQRIRTGNRVAVLKSHRCVLVKRRIEDVEVRLFTSEVVNRDVELTGLVIYQRRKTLGEGAAAAVLTG